MRKSSTMVRLFRGIGIILAVIAYLYLIGPRPASITYTFKAPDPPKNLGLLEREIKLWEDRQTLRPEMAARIVWADSVPQKTKWSIVYLPGFTASWKEADPIHFDIARRYGVNLFLARPYAHGEAGPDPMLKFHPDSALNAALYAIKVGHVLGDSVLVMSTSTGATYALAVAAATELVHAQVVYSPNIRIANDAAFLMDNPWGLQILRKMSGGNYRGHTTQSDSFNKYWLPKYRIESLVSLQQLIEDQMQPATFSKINHPLFLAYYYKNELEQDQVVSVPAMLRMFEQLGTHNSRKKKEAFPKAGDHVIGSSLKSKDIEGVRTATINFLESALGWKPKS